MLTINQLKPAPHSKKNKTRVGRGRGSGQGCTAGYGNNGARARSGANIKLYYEGGQTPLTRRLPKRGFHNRFGTEYQIVNLSSFQNLSDQEKEFTIEKMFSLGLIHSDKKLVKVLADGELTKPVTIKAHAFSQTAREKIEKVKGKAEVISHA